MYDLANFKMSHMIECGTALRQLSVGAQSMEEVANRIVHYLYDHLIDQQTGEKECALVRLYKTHPYGELDEELQEFARALLGGHPELPEIKCLTLLATAGKRPAWNSRKNSVGHKAIPLYSEQTVTRIPMILRLIQQFGLEISHVVKPDPALLVELEQKTYNVFYVSEAVGSPFVPAQEEFVIPFGIKSVLGFGGMLPSGDLFVIIIFSKVHISQETTELFKTLTLNVKMAVLPFMTGPIFA
ncbi:MAG: hypothetical protein HY035_01460 [Nitrospirae bacterium]|nr:hypothetical protein [Nitrospirota bacterium]